MYVIFLYGLLVNYAFCYYYYYYYYYTESESAFFIEKKCLIPTAINFVKSRSAARSKAVIAKAAKIKMKKKIGSRIPPKSRLGSFVKQTVGRVI